MQFFSKTNETTWNLREGAAHSNLPRVTEVHNVTYSSGASPVRGRNDIIM